MRRKRRAGNKRPPDTQRRNPDPRQGVFPSVLDLAPSPSGAQADSSKPGSSPGETPPLPRQGAGSGDPPWRPSSPGADAPASRAIPESPNEECPSEWAARPDCQEALADGPPHPFPSRIDPQPFEITEHPPGINHPRNPFPTSLEVSTNSEHISQVGKIDSARILSHPSQPAQQETGVRRPSRWTAAGLNALLAVLRELDAKTKDRPARFPPESQRSKAEPGGRTGGTPPSGQVGSAGAPPEPRPGASPEIPDSNGGH